MKIDNLSEFLEVDLFSTLSDALSASKILIDYEVIELSSEQFNFFIGHPTVEYYWKEFVKTFYLKDLHPLQVMDGQEFKFLGINWSIVDE